MRINLSNYEAWFLDYHEGNLDEVALEELSRFLEGHPHLKEEFDSFEAVPLEKPEVRYPDKANLRKSVIAPANRLTWFIAWHEGDLSKEERQSVDEFLMAHPAFHAEFEQCRKLRVLPDYTIVFGAKDVLKRGLLIRGRLQPYIRYAAAAVLALLVVSYFVVQDDGGKPVVVHRNEVSPKQSEKSSVHNPVAEKEPAVTRREVREQRQQVSTSPAAQLPVTARAEETTPILAATPGPVPLVQPAEQAAIATGESTHAMDTIRKTRNRLTEVFTQEDLEEMGLTAKEERKKPGLWDLVEKGANGINKVTGSEISLSRHEDEEEESRSYQFAIGSFSVSHKQSK